MAKAYSADMRQRVIGRVESGASRREAAEHYEVSPSTAVIWMKCFRETGRCAAKPRGGSTSPLLFGWLIESGSAWRVSAGYGLAAALLLIAAGGLVR